MRLPWVVLAVAACGGRGGVDGGAAGPAASPAPDLAVVRRTDARIVVMSADGSHVRALGAAQPRPMFATTMWSSDGRFVLYPAGDHLDSSSIVELGGALPRSLGQVHARCALPDGRFVVTRSCVGGDDECTFALDPSTLDSIELDGVPPVELACSPRGSIAWMTRDGLVVARSTGRALYREMLAFPAPDLLVWSDDERYLAWSNVDSTGVFDLATGRLTRVASARCEALEVVGGRLSAVCDGMARELALDGSELPDRPIPVTAAARSPDGSQLAFTTGSGLFVQRAGKPIEIASGRFGEPAWRPARPRVPRIDYPNVADPQHARAPAKSDDVSAEVTIGVDRAHASVDAAMRDRFTAQIRSQLELFRACYRPRAAAIPGLAVAMRITVAAENPQYRGPSSEATAGYDVALDACVLAATRALRLGDDPPGVFALDLTFGHPGAPGAVSPPIPARPRRATCGRPPCGVARPQLGAELAVVTTGALDADATTRVFRAIVGRLRACYAIERDRRPGLAGTLEVSVAIGAAGAVASATPSGGTLHDATTIACVARELEHLRFPPGRAGSARVRLAFSAPFGYASPLFDEHVKLDMGPVDTAGALDARATSEAIRARTGDYRACYIDALGRDPQLAGTLDLELAIGAAGSATGATITGGTLRDRALGECVASAAKRGEFPASHPGTAHARFAYTFVPHVVMR